MHLTSTFWNKKKLSKTSLFPDNNKCMCIRFPIFKLNIITLEKHRLYRKNISFFGY